MEDITLEDYPVVTEIPIAWGEMDSFQHVNNVTYFRYFETSCVAYLNKISIFDLKNTTGIGPILASTRCRFKVPLKYPDTILVCTRVTKIGIDRFTMEHRVVSRKLSKTAAEGEGVLITYDYKNERKVPIPAAIRQGILDLEKRNLSPQ